MAKSTPVPVEEQACCNPSVFMAVHVMGNEEEILGVFTTEKEAKKCAASAKKADGYKGKEAKLHSYNVVSWELSDKFEGR
jgi:hypothetical protein